ncbi:hypothetical protein O3P69_010090 [Scylla paramamosain]|uniref:Gustatory receptor n=1 Tax=Scylla paramamosain TaxID=85552 RepID=A0AAW0SNF0_SCYPA
MVLHCEGRMSPLGHDRMDCIPTPHHLPPPMDDYLPHVSPTPFIHVVRWSKLWGCLPIAYNKSAHSWCLSPFLTFWVVCMIGVNLPTFYDCIKASLGSDGLMLYVMVMIVCVMSVSAVSMHVLGLVYYGQWIDFLNNWMTFERQFPTLTVGVRSLRVSYPLFIGFFLYVLFFVVNILNELRFNLINNDGVWRMLSLVYVYVIYSFTLSMPVLWVVMASKVFVVCLCHIRHELESIVECVKYGVRCTNSPIQKCIATGDMNRMQEAVLDLARLIESFKVIMGPFMLIIVPHHIISLICFLYWTLVSTLDYSDWYSPLSFSLLSAQAIIPIFCAAIYSEDVHTQKESLIEPLIILKSTMADETAKHKMATLIDHLDRLDAQVEGRGFFTLNKSMATSVVNTVVTYLVVLIQFYGGGRKR